MPTKKYKAEQIVSLLRQIEVAVANGKATPQACRDAGFPDQSYSRWSRGGAVVLVNTASATSACDKKGVSK